MSAASHFNQTSQPPSVTADGTPAPTVLVTGANGLVGQALCRELAGQGFAVQAAVREPEAFAPIAGVSVVQAPDLEDTQAQWPLAGVDVVVHTAARVHVMNPAPDEIDRFAAVNRDGSARLAHACAQTGVKRLVFLSTIKVNGEHTEDGHAFAATDPVVAPTDPYALSKYEAERKLFDIAKASALQVVVVRSPLVYGPGARGNLELLERAIRRGVPLPIGSLDSNHRSLVSLANLVDLLVRCAIHPRAAGEVFLASDGDDLSTLELARHIAKACHLPLRFLPMSARLLNVAARALGKDDMMRRLTQNLQVDISATCETLDWHPPQTVAQGMSAAFAESEA